MLALATIAFGFCSCEDVPMPYGYPQGSTDPTNPDLPAEGEGTLESPYNVAAANAVIAGGDFNQTFPGTLEKYPVKDPSLWVPGVLEQELLPEGWSFVYDDSVPSCRLNNQPYDANDEATQHYLIDGFIISPNVELLSVNTLDKGFVFSDHNPVEMNVKLK